jgi:hypothetical protein
MKSKSRGDRQWRVLKGVFFISLILFVWINRGEEWFSVGFRYFLVAVGFYLSISFIGWFIRFKKSIDINGRWKVVERMHHRAFEHFVGNLFETMNYKVDVTRGVADHGHDLVLFKDSKRDFEDMKYIAEVKHYASDNKIGEARIRDFAGALRMARVSNGIYVTSSFFTSKAIEACMDLNIKPVDGDELKKWVMKLSRRKFLSIVSRSEKAK